MMIKPSGSQCNIDCEYCFYLHKENLLNQPKSPRMSDAVLEQHIVQYINAQTTDEVVFTWQGGEPTLMGLAFFKKAVELQKRHAKPNQRILNDLQTNGLLIDDEWCQFLKAENFLVGISIDGPKPLHDKLRVTKNGKPTFDYVKKAINLLHQYQIPFHALCVVNHYNAQAPLEVYRFLRDEVRSRMIQFLSAVAPVDFDTQATLYMRASPDANERRIHTHASCVTDWSVTPDDWGRFLVTVWHEWLANDYGKVFVDQFENTISQAFGLGAQKCTTAPICGKALAIEHNGDVYSCDHFVYPEYRLGNITQIDESKLTFSQQQASFGYAKHLNLPSDCKRCKFLKLCWGECPKNRFIADSDGTHRLNYLCTGLKTYFSQVAQDLPTIHSRLTQAKVIPQAHR
ncbi:anaerobic sulfatase maturase [Moraxella sp. RCAD0137]|uniref:anaerobic sulfatase maturase n=1 Tax=Moraxella sp. RCAD0137 TaxID=1775913 RepID=UPI0018ED3FEF|nr:anaerobic sulfatase maturase [Moraxella sp. RCAD0137]